jgi:hypothetical protein
MTLTLAFLGAGHVVNTALAWLYVVLRIAHSLVFALPFFMAQTASRSLPRSLWRVCTVSCRHVASSVGLAPSPYKIGDVDRDRGISKAGTKLARQTLVELAWFWLRHQPNSKLSLWWHERFGDKGMRGRKVGIVALARKLAIALWTRQADSMVANGPDH